MTARSDVDGPARTTHHGAPTADLERLIGATSPGRLGAVLLGQRQRAGVEREAAAAAAQLDARAFQRVEAGQDKPSAPAVARLLELYCCSLDDLLPPRQRLDPTMFAHMSETQILSHYVGQVRAWRGTSSPRGFRVDDLSLLVGILGTDPRTIERKLRAATGCDHKTAKIFRRLLLVGLVVATGTLVGQGVVAAAEGKSAAVQTIATGPANLRPVATTGQPAPTPITPTPVTPTAATIRSSSVRSSSVRSSSVQSAPASVKPGAVANDTVSVLAYVNVDVDAAGNVIAVRTNTGNPPSAAEAWSTFDQQHPDAGVPSDPELIQTVIAAAASNPNLPAAGAWHPGTWYLLDTPSR